MDLEKANWTAIVYNGSPLLCITDENNVSIGGIEGEARACLCAAAPDMLRALEKINAFMMLAGEYPLLDSLGVTQAIAKAKGEPYE